MPPQPAQSLSDKVKSYARRAGRSLENEGKQAWQGVKGAVSSLPPVLDYRLAKTATDRATRALTGGNK